MKTKTIYYIGKRYLTFLETPKFGRIDFEDNGRVELPEPYANHVLENSPLLFTDKAPKSDKKLPGDDYRKMEWASLKKYAAERNVTEKKKDKIIAELVKLDDAKQAKKEEE